MVSPLIHGGFLKVLPFTQYLNPNTRKEMWRCEYLSGSYIRSLEISKVQSTQRVEIFRKLLFLKSLLEIIITLILRSSIADN